MVRLSSCIACGFCMHSLHGCFSAPAGKDLPKALAVLAELTWSKAQSICCYLLVTICSKAATNKDTGTFIIHQDRIFPVMVVNIQFNTKLVWALLS